MGIVSRNKGAGAVRTAPLSGRMTGLPLAVSLVLGRRLRMLVMRLQEIETSRLAACHAGAAHRRWIVEAVMVGDAEGARR